MIFFFKGMKENGSKNIINFLIFAAEVPIINTYQLSPHVRVFLLFIYVCPF